VFVFVDNKVAEDISLKYDFNMITDLKTGRSVGLKNNAFLLGDAFDYAKFKVNGSVIIFINGDNIVIPSEIAFDTILSKTSEKTRGDFTCIGRRNELKQYDGVFADDIRESYEKVISLRSSTERIPHGVDICVWSYGQFLKIKTLPITLVGWFCDNWMVTEMVLNCQNRFYLSGVFETIHPAHKSPQVRQITVAKKITDYNRKVLVNSYPDRNIDFMETPPNIPDEWINECKNT
jgi:hypothetical protein